MAAHVDPGDRTFLYALRVAEVFLAPDAADLEGLEVVCQWSVHGERHSTQAFPLGSPLLGDSCAFLVASFACPQDRSLYMRLVLSEPGHVESVCGALVDLASLGASEAPQEGLVPLRRGPRVAATARLLTAAQRRWQRGAPVVPRPEAFFARPGADEQARGLLARLDPSAAAGPAAAPAAAEECPPPAAAGPPSARRSDSETSQLLAAYLDGRRCAAAPRAEGAAAEAAASPPRAAASPARAAPGEAAAGRRAPGHTSGPRAAAPLGGGAGGARGGADVAADVASALLGLAGCAPGRLACAEGLFSCRWGGGRQEDIVEAPAPARASEDSAEPEEFLARDLEVHWRRHGSHDKATLHEISPSVVDGLVGDVAL